MPITMNHDTQLGKKKTRQSTLEGAKLAMVTIVISYMFSFMVFL